MKPEPEAPTESVNGRLVDYLTAKKDAILTEWLERVYADPAITSTDILNTYALKNHLPEIFDDLIDTFRQHGSEVVSGQSVKDAEEHGATRLRQGYELTEMLREIKLLRTVLILHLRIFENLNQDEGMAARIFVSTTLHAFLDEMAINATQEYLWAQMSLQDRLSLGQTKC